jgi:hypothetical protein
VILVLAGNKNEFERFLENHEPRNIFRFINDEADYEGCKDCDVVLAGSYENNPLWMEMDKRIKLQKYCHSSGMNIIDRYVRNNT